MKPTLPPTPAPDTWPPGDEAPTDPDLTAVSADYRERRLAPAGGRVLFHLREGSRRPFRIVSED